MGNTSGNCLSCEGVLNSASCSVLISCGRGRGAPRERARGLRVLFGGGRIRARLGSRTVALSAERTSNVTGPVLHLVEPHDDRALHLLTTMAPKFREAAQALIRVTKERGRQVLERRRKVVTHRGLTVQPLLVESRPAEEIIRAAERTHADLVLLGSRGMTGLKGAILGSVARKVARHASCSVLVVRRTRR